MKTFTVSYTDQSRPSVSFRVRGICRCDVLNPCWDGRPTDVPGRHWAGGPACQPCTEVARSAA